MIGQMQAELSGKAGSAPRQSGMLAALTELGSGAPGAGDTGNNPDNVMLCLPEGDQLPTEAKKREQLSEPFVASDAVSEAPPTTGRFLRRFMNDKVRTGSQ